MGNVENKGHIQTPNNRERARFNRLFNRVIPGVRTLNGEGTARGTLSPCTDHDGECPVCLQPNTILLRYSSCSHMACTLCWLTFLCTEIDSFAMSRLTCIGCKNPLPATTVIQMLTTAIKDPDSYGAIGNDDDPPFSYAHCARMLSRYEEFLLRKALSREPDVRWCPSGCGYGLIAHGFKACPRLFCLSAECHGRSFCYNCQKPWHSSRSPTTPECSSDPDDSTPHVCTPEKEDRNETVEGVMAFFGVRRMRRRASAMNEPSPGHSTASNQFPFQRMQSTEPCINENGSGKPNEYTSSIAGTNSSGRVSPNGCASSASSGSEELRRSTGSVNSSDGGEIKACPRCNSMIQKLNDGSCNDMVCAICGFNFCWLCLRENTVGHYISLSGCTVWGRKQWSTRRRIFTLIGLILGTPILLPIIVAVGIPACSIAIIVGLCYMVSGSFPFHRKHLRRFAVFCTCLSSLLVAPVAASLLAALAVPIVLGYVYIYLPISVFSSLGRRSPATPEVPDVSSIPIPVAISVDSENTT